ncbi:MAG: hypothetical protein ABSD81_04510 [Methanomicrobiales archaeon]
MVIAFNPKIAYENPDGLVKDLINTCITVLSIAIATILAYTAIIETRSPGSVKNNLIIFSMIIPIIGILFGLFSLYYSYFSETFELGKILLAVTMELTIGSILLLLLLSIRETGGPQQLKGDC